MQRLAAAALAELLTEYVEELDDYDPTELRSVESITLDIARFLEERLPADEGADEQW